MICVTFLDDFINHLSFFYSVHHHLLKLSVQETSLLEALLLRWYFFSECWQCSHSRFRFKLSDSGSDVVEPAGGAPPPAAVVELMDMGGANMDACCPLLDRVGMEEKLLHCSVLATVEDEESRLVKSELVEQGLLGLFFWKSHWYAYSSSSS